MKFIALFILAFLFIPTNPEYPGCIDGVGHVKVKYQYLLRDTTGLVYNFDTTVVDDDSLEWLIVPEGFDTLIFQCMRCDSIVIIPSDTVRIFARIINTE